jgi:hypothetical protein
MVMLGGILLPSSAQQQTPILKVDNKEESGVYLKDLSINIKVAGTIASTTLQMTFFNSNARILEGELTIPLPEAVSISRYALDINGKMREAVPVDKAKGTQVFEAIERRGVDPGLLEKVEGNNFRTRIYPIPAKGQRTIIIGYDQELTFGNDHSLRYYIPLNYKKPIPEFTLDVTVLQSRIKPHIEEDPGGLVFEEWNNNYSASIHKNNFIPGSALSFLIPKTVNESEIMVQQKEEGYYFLVNLFPNKDSKPKRLPDEITVIWDVSLSGLHRNIPLELELLGAYLKNTKKILVSLVAFNNQARKLREYFIQNGNWNELKKDIERFTYDGGTSFENIIYPASEEYLLFTDGISSFTNTNFPFPDKPVYTITSSPRSDFSQLQYISQKTSGRFINLNTLKTEEAVKLLIEQPLQIISIRKSNATEEIYPSFPFPIINNCSLAGFTRDAFADITIVLGYGSSVQSEKRIVLNASRHTVTKINIERIWAQKKIAQLDIQYDKNKNTIEHLGKKYGIVTRNTSLIVLELVNDYVQYEIEPPAELREEYNRLLKERNRLFTQQQRVINNNAELYFNRLKDWYGIEIEEDKTKTNQPIPRASGNPGSGNTVTNRTTTNNPVHSDLTNQIEPGNANLSEVVVVGYGVSSRRALTASITTIRNNQLTNGNSINSALAGRVAGLSINPHNGFQINNQTNITIRGVGSFTGNNPQFIIDGRVASAEEIQLLNINDIESIEVIKGGYYIPSGRTPGRIYFNRKDPRLPLINWKKIRFISDTSRALFKAGDGTLAAPYISALAKTPQEKRYQKYLEIREAYINSPAFYFNTATWFLENDDYETGLTILQNLTELDLQDHELYKMMGYKFKELGEYNMSVQAFRKVLEWRPMEPQSYRDYALALQDAGYFQNALDTLHLALTRNYASEVTGMYPGIEEMIVTEINQLLSLHKKLDRSDIPESLIKPMPVDLRVVVNWNMNDTDLDLWVTDPIGEKCYYGHKNTQVGGRLSNDFTRGYGPEQFLLKKAVRGRYKVQVHFYGERQVKLVGPTTAQAEIIIHYGTANQQRQVITLQMEKGGGTVLIGEFEVK